jgi:erythromycin esterase-like protein
MATNIARILAHQPTRTRMIVWAHNGHIANNLRDPSDGYVNMGDHLEDHRVVRLGQDLGRSVLVLCREHRTALTHQMRGREPVAHRARPGERAEVEHQDRLAGARERATVAWDSRGGARR